MQLYAFTKCKASNFKSTKQLAPHPCFSMFTGGDSLYATAQWAMAKLDSRACRKLIAATIASYSHWDEFVDCCCGSKDLFLPFCNNFLPEPWGNDPI